MVRGHGGNVDVIDDPDRFPVAAVRVDFPASGAGVVQEADAEKIGRASLVLGAGRAKTTDVIDPAAGLSGLAKIGERVVAGQPLATLHAATQERIEAALPWVRQAFVIGDQPVMESPLVLERIFTTRNTHKS